MEPITLDHSDSLPRRGNDHRHDTGPKAQCLLQSTIFYTLLVVIALTAIPNGTVDPWWKAAFECAVFALGVLWVVEGFRRGVWFVSKHRLLIPLAVLVIFAGIQMALPLRSMFTSGVSTWRPISFSSYDTRLFVYHLLALIVATGLLLQYTTSRRRLKILVCVAIGVGFGSAVFGLIQALQGESRFVSGQFINHNHFAFLLEMSLGLVLGLIVGRGLRLWYVAIGFAFALPMWAAIVYSGSRGGLISMTCQVIFLGLLQFSARSGLEFLGGNQSRLKRRSRSPQFLATSIVLICSLATLMMIGIVWVGGDPLVHRLQAGSSGLGAKESDNYTNTNRRQIWSTTLLLIKEHPIAGVGFGGYWMAITNYHHASGDYTPQQAHNDYLELLASGGLIGLALGFWFVLGLIKDLPLNLRSPDPFLRASCYGALAGILGVTIHSLVDFGLHITINSLVLMVLVVIATARVGDAKQGETDLVRGGNRVSFFQKS